MTTGFWHISVLFFMRCLNMFHVRDISHLALGRATRMHPAVPPDGDENVQNVHLLIFCRTQVLDAQTANFIQPWRACRVMCLTCSFREQRKNGTLRCSAGLEWHGCHRISDTEASALAPTVGQPSKSAGCLAAKKNFKKPSLASTISRFC